MSKSLFRYLSREGGQVASPVAERRTEAKRCELTGLHALQSGMITLRTTKVPTSKNFVWAVGCT